MWVDAGKRGRVRGLPCGMGWNCSLLCLSQSIRAILNMGPGIQSYQENKAGSRSGEDGKAGGLFAL